jgi:hypothetical protein
MRRYVRGHRGYSKATFFTLLPVDQYPLAITKVFDTQCGFECFWQGLRKLGLPKARALYHGRTRRFRIDLTCRDAEEFTRLQTLETEAQRLETHALALENLWGPDLSRRRFED